MVLRTVCIPIANGVGKDIMNMLLFCKGLFRRVRSRILGNRVRLAGQCRLCGKCCSDILLCHNGRWLRRESEYQAMLAEVPEHSRFERAGRNCNGYLTFSCTCLGREKWCTDYGNRPALCSHYPSESLYYAGRELQADCGYSFTDVTFRQAIRRRLTGKPAFSQVLDELVRKDTNDTDA